MAASGQAYQRKQWRKRRKMAKYRREKAKGNSMALAMASMALAAAIMAAGIGAWRRIMQCAYQWRMRQCVWRQLAMAISKMRNISEIISVAA